jgi:hypothetical protein
LVFFLSPMEAIHQEIKKRYKHYVLKKNSSFELTGNESFKSVSAYLSTDNNPKFENLLGIIEGMLLQNAPNERQLSVFLLWPSKHVTSLALINGINKPKPFYPELPIDWPGVELSIENLSDVEASLIPYLTILQHEINESGLQILFLDPNLVAWDSEHGKNISDFHQSINQILRYAEHFHEATSKVFGD